MQLLTDSPNNMRAREPSRGGATWPLTGQLRTGPQQAKATATVPLLRHLHSRCRNPVPFGTAGCKAWSGTSRLFRKLRRNVLLIHYSPDRAGDRNATEEKGRFFASLHSFLFLCPFLCLRLGLDSSNPRGDKTPDRDGKATWGRRRSAPATATHSPAPLAAAAASYSCGFTSVAANSNHLKTRTRTWKNHKAPSTIITYLQIQRYIYRVCCDSCHPCFIAETSAQLRLSPVRIKVHFHADSPYFSCCSWAI